MKRIVFASLIALLASSAAFADIESNVARSFPVAPGGKLVVDADSGDIEVHSGTGASVDVVVHRTARTNSSSKAKQTFDEYPATVTKAGNDVKVRIEHESSWFNLDFGNDIRIRTVVTVPRNFHLALQTAGGDVSVSEVSGEIAAHTSGGDMTFRSTESHLVAGTSGGDIVVTGNRGITDLSTSGGDISASSVAGALSARTSGGDIRITSLDGPLEAKTSGGEIVLQDVRGGVNAKTSGGDVVARFSVAPRSDVTLATSGGGVKLFMPQGSSFDLDAETSGGEVASDLPVTVRGTHEADSLVGRAGNGGPKVRLRSSAGDIRIAVSR